MRGEKGGGDSVESPQTKTVESTPPTEERAEKAHQVGGASFNDFAALFAASPTAIALFSFVTPPPLGGDPTHLLNEIFAHPPQCVEANVRFMKAFMDQSGRSLIGRDLGEILPRTAEYTALFKRWIESDFRLIHSSANPTFVEHDGAIYEFSLYPVFKGGTLAKIWVLFRDVSDLQHALDSARRAEAHYRTLVERPGLVLVRTRPDNTYVYLSPHIVDIIGYTPEDFKRNPGLFEKLLHPEDVAKHAAIYHARKTKSRRTVEVEFRVRRTDGAYQWFLERQTPLIDSTGEVAHYDSVAIDISERKHLEAQLLHSQRLDVMGKLSSGIAHDFNNHLTAIMGQIKLAEHALESHHPARYELAGAERAAQGCAEMIKQILAFGRKSEARSTRLDLASTIETTLQMLRHFLPSSVTLESRIEREAGEVVGTSSQLQQVLMNLGINARDAMPTGGTLTVSVTPITLPRARGIAYPSIEPGEYIEVIVADTGTGMPPTILPHIFEPFFTTKPAGAGTGLGLSMARSILEDHGGAIGVESATGQGTKMAFILPRASTPARRGETEPALTAKSGAGCILVADDDSMVLSVASTALNLHGYAVLRANDGEHALELYDKHAKEIDLVFVDQTMPRRSGREVMATLRKKRPQLPIIYTSGHGKVGPLGDITDDEHTVFIGKPYALGDLLVRVRELLDQSGSRPADE